MAEAKRKRWFGRGVGVKDRPEGAGAGAVGSDVVTGSAAAEDSSGPVVASSGVAAQITRVPDGAPTNAILARLSDYLHVQVRSGVYDGPALRALAIEAAETETPDRQQADEWARQVLAEQVESWYDDADRWGGRTDCDRLDEALGRLIASGVTVHAGLVDEGALAESIRVSGGGSGCVSYLVSDIWRAIDVNSLNLTVLDEMGHPAARDAQVVHQLHDALSAAGLLATDGHDNGIVEVALVWRRRPPS